MKNKELTPLEALEDLISFIGSGFVADTHELCEYVAKRKDIIETALKDYENLKEENKLLIISYYKIVEERNKLQYTLDELEEKELKALEIIKEKNVLILTLKNVESVGIYNDCLGVSEKLTQEQFDLLREVLK